MCIMDGARIGQEKPVHAEATQPNTGDPIGTYHHANLLRNSERFETRCGHLLANAVQDIVRC